MNYYPFGMPYEFTSRLAPELQPYKFGGKELDEMHGLNWYDQGARPFDAIIPRTPTMDPLAEKYYSSSPYAMFGNNPVRYVDPDGKEISFTYEWEKDEDGNYVINKSGGRNLIGLTMNVTGKVINISSNSKVNMTDAANRISSQIESSFSGDVDGIKFSTNVSLSVANSMDDVSESDHVFALADFDNSGSTGSLQGYASSFGGKVAFIDADLFTGSWDTKHNLGPGNAAHEFGHLAGLDHTIGLMQKNPGGIWIMSSTKVGSSQLTEIYKKHKAGKLNQGSNWEYRKIMSPTAGGYIYKKMPFRGAASRYINY
jgi:RHS repeat-associated protein